METLILLLIVGGVIYFLVKKKTSTGTGAAPTADPGFPEHEGAWKYRHSYRDTAIGLNPTGKIVRLQSRFLGGVHKKDYKYEDVRNLEFKVFSGGMTRTFGNVGVGAGIGVGVANYMQARQNEAETGLFLTVRDIDFPEWQIMFAPDKGRDLELKRWMELLRQEINRD